jgi:uncharacterized repeat protein (TIGR02543 family)
MKNINHLLLVSAVILLALAAWPASAVFADGEHTVTYEANGGKFEGWIDTDKIVYDYNSEFVDHAIAYPKNMGVYELADGTLKRIAIVSLTRSGYKFVGWVDQDGKVHNPGEAKLTVGGAKDWVLKASWEEVDPDPNTTSMIILEPQVSTSQPASQPASQPEPATQVSSAGDLAEPAKPGKDNPGTSDSSNLAAWGVICAASLAGLVCLSARKRHSGMGN